MKRASKALIASAAIVSAVTVPMAAVSEFDWPWAQQTIESHEQRITALEQHDGVPTPSSSPTPATAPADSQTGQTPTTPADASAEQSAVLATPNAAPAASAPVVTAVNERSQPETHHLTCGSNPSGNSCQSGDYAGFDYYCDYTYSDGTKKETYLGWSSQPGSLSCPSQS